MPIALDPKRKFYLVLKTDQELPPDQQPRFAFRYMTGRKWIGMADLYDAQKEAKTGGKKMSAIYDVVRYAIVGWERINDPETGEAIAYDPAKLEDILTPGEAVELFEAVMERIKPTGDDKKNSGSPAPSSGADSAPPAPATAA